MSLEFAILGFLHRNPKTGYELQKIIESSINHFWKSTQSQIYRTLSKMEENGSVVSEFHYQDERPNKKIFTITSKGEKELIQWLSTPIDLPSHRNPFLVQLFFSDNVETKKIISNLLHYKEELEERLIFLKSKKVQNLVSSGKSKTERVIYKALVNNGISVLQSEIDWASATIQEISNT